MRRSSFISALSQLLLVLLALGVAVPPAVAQEAAEEKVYMIVVTGRDSSSVYINGIFEGVTADDGQLDVDLVPGEYVITAEREGFVPGETVWVQDEDAVTDNIFVTLDPLPPAPEPEAPREGGNVIFVALLAVCGLLAASLAYAVTRKRKHESTFDRYAVLRTIGRGGMATVFLARDGDDEIALKVMDPGLLRDGELVRKFLKEGEVLQTIAESAPAAPVVRALRYGRENGDETGRPFVALEYIPGDTLLEFCRTAGRLNPEQAIGVAQQVCRGLEAAHREGVWHRDVSPDNVLLVEEEPTRDEPLAVKLIDFGVAKNEYTQAKTLDGSISGKPPYMSPEQCRGESIDGRSDLYSVGVMLYTMLAGQPPFTDTNPLLVMRQHETAPVPPLPDEVPTPLADLVMRLLSKDRADRPESAAAVVSELSALARTV